MRLFVLILISALVFTGPSLLGQLPARQQAMKAYEAGVQLLLDGKAKRATRSLRTAVERDSTFLPGRRLLGAAYELQRDYPAALEHYRFVLRADPDFSRLLYFRTGLSYLRLGRGREATDYFTRFRALQGRELAAYGLVGQQERPDELEVLASELDGALVAAQLLSDSLNYTNASDLYNLGPAINSRFNDYFPFFSNDRTQLLYTRQDAEGDEDLMEGRREAAGDREFRSGRFSSFNTRQPEGMCTLVRDGETIYYTLCQETEAGGSGCDLYAGTLVDGKIRDVERLPDYLNSTTWDSQAAISCDGRQLYFASTRPGGLGGSDLYACYRLPDGSWSEPRNLGDGVNTAQDEEAPFLSNDGETLYFSSMGHGGLGDQDIYFSRYAPDRERWSKAINLGPPINSANRELGFHLTADGRRGFFASDRPGGLGGLDIYGFRLTEELTGKDVTFVSGYVTDSLTGKAIVEQEVPIGGDLFRTNYAGRFFICAQPEADLSPSVTHPDYLPYRRDFTIPVWDNLAPYRIDLRLATATVAAPPPPPETTDLPTKQIRFLFEFEQDRLSEEQRQALLRFIASVGPERIVTAEVVGYTDDRGTDAYNIDLSERRAATVAGHLLRAGVREADISQAGRGELPGARSRRENRRVEITLRLRQ